MKKPMAHRIDTISKHLEEMTEKYGCYIATQVSQVLLRFLAVEVFQGITNLMSA